MKYPLIELKILTNNNVVNHAAEGLDFAIRFGMGTWPVTDNTFLFDAPLTALCSHEVAKRITIPHDLVNETLLRSYQPTQWENWLIKAGLKPWPEKGTIFDSSRLMVEAAIESEGIALAPTKMFASELARGELYQPFNIEVNMGSYWLTRLKTKRVSPAMRLFQDWLYHEITQS